jgi:hypothetical protein
MQATKKIQIILLMIASLVFVNTASAKVLTMTGTWFQNRGPLIDIPQKGGAVPCYTAPSAPVQGGLENGCIANLAPLLGGIDGAANLVVSGSNPAQFVIPTDAFSLFPGQPWVGAVAVAPTVQQLASTFTFMGPGRVGAAGNPSAAAFMANAWSNDPGQSGTRLAANFSWCPGGGTGGSGAGPGVSACADPWDATPTSAGNWNGRITYTAGGNAFGGTMAMLMGGVGYVSVVITAIPGFPAAIGHQQIGGGVGVQGAQVQGAGYAFVNSNAFPAGNAYATFMTAFPCTIPMPALPYGCDVITAQGFGLGPVIPADSQFNFGMPWTTGTVAVSNTGTNKGAPANTNLTAMGYDNRTALGAGKITLVAGGTTHRMANATANPQNYGAFDIVNLTIGQTPVPAMSPMGLATAAVLMMLAVGYAFRRRLVTNA